MTDNLKESLSALIDGEASELEVHRLLRRLDSDESLRTACVNYLQVRAVIRGENVLSADRHLALQDRIAVAVSGEETYSHKPAPAAGRRYHKPAGIAIAASVLVAVIATFTPTSTDVEEPGVAASGAETAAGATVPMQAQPLEGQLVSTESAPPLDELKELTEDQQRQLRAYLNRHDRSRLDPNVRTVIYDSKASGN